ncbi:hypothetical protein A3I25_02015 [Candidatus Nomurabacteria bacterium RIFCSPLOWO2_02_FULL_42_17]|uniref:Uncharacterized protein n=2 Tax=Candidatus Nomuraibacteriota TaxID=1752729 RepID=A0A1F6WHN3_9BACT|nr:MAG: hypothetical protein UV08_C0019G0009 [Parcubacteria group bacterium GW2011_GWA2_42_18]OGI81389.1 MAG: hypothetical protein A3B93_01650 [Candidatus Nomurabacteria bacterium RIFCSPHIGHO2_02_FULL_42_24]OGI97552.1 MAG: hypothetical protein A3I25_02015 [Candidatus Nomurabacteria bacterium RIFCSPLOWO2_02_FULL_42_17]
MKWFRILANIALLVAVLWLPFWVTVLLVLVGLFYFRNYYEALIALLLIDLIYGVPLARWGGWPLVSFSIGIVLFIGAEILKRRLKFYERS